jgi:hypothetical protein
MKRNERAELDYNQGHWDGRGYREKGAPKRRAIEPASPQSGASGFLGALIILIAILASPQGRRRLPSTSRRLPSTINPESRRDTYANMRSHRGGRGRIKLDGVERAHDDIAGPSGFRARFNARRKRRCFGRAAD